MYSNLRHQVEKGWYNIDQPSKTALIQVMLLSVADKMKHVILLNYSNDISVERCELFSGYVKHLSFGKNLITVYFTTQNRHSLYSGIHSIPNIACGLLVPIWVKPFKLGSPPL